MDNTIVYNPKKGASINKFPHDGRVWSLGINKMAKFPSNISAEMLRRFGFLRKVKPEDIVKIKEEMKSKDFNCEFCEYETDTQKRINMHKLAKHKMSKETRDLMDGIPAAAGTAVAGSISVGHDPNVSPEGIPLDERDGWVGAGLEDDTVTSMATPKVGSKGVF